MWHTFCSAVLCLWLRVLQSVEASHMNCFLWHISGATHQMQQGLMLDVRAESILRDWSWKLALALVWVIMTNLWASRGNTLHPWGKYLIQKVLSDNLHFGCMSENPTLIIPVLRNCAQTCQLCFYFMILGSFWLSKLVSVGDARDNVANNEILSICLQPQGYNSKGCSLELLPLPLSCCLATGSFWQQLSVLNAIAIMGKTA